MIESIKLGDVITDIAAGPFGSNLKVSCFVDDGFPIVDGANLKGYKLTDNITKFVTEEKARSLHKSIAKKNDIVVTISGTVGQISYIPMDSKYEEYLCSQRQFRATFDTNRVYVPYLVFYFHTYEGKHKILSFANQVGVPALSQPLKNFRLIDIDLPDIETQRRIAGIIEIINSRIENNDKINENLQEQALALFRQFFMDFVPYGGVAPSDWTEVSLDDVCTRITDGSHYSPADVPDSPYPMYSVKDMETYGFNPSSCKHISEEDFQKMQKGDCVPLLNDILVAKDGSYLKEIFICSEEKDEAILSSIAIFRPDTKIIMPEILLYLLKQPSVRKDVGDNYVSGSALPRIVLKDFKKYRFMLPPMDEQLKIGSVLHAIRMQTKANIDEIQCLSSTRDALLPKLMSGELDVSNLDL